MDMFAALDDLKIELLAEPPLDNGIALKEIGCEKIPSEREEAYYATLAYLALWIIGMSDFIKPWDKDVIHICVEKCPHCRYFVRAILWATTGSMKSRIACN